MPSDTLSYVTLARILRPQGRRGEVAAEILTDFPGRLRILPAAELWDGQSQRRRVKIKSCWLTVGRAPKAVFHFEGSDSISDAERLVGLEIQVPIADRVPLGPGKYYITDLIGCELYDREGNRIGKVDDVQPIGEELPGPPVIVVDSPVGELLVPLAEEICTKIDVAEKRIEVVLPEGLRELNRE